ncbi:type II secretion system protein J [Patescibacteria group bacterium]
MIKKNKKGFTLVEILVAITMFALISTAAIGIFTTTIKSQKRILAHQKLLDQTSFVLEYVSRSFRMAKKDDVGGINCLLGSKINYEITSTGQGGIKIRNYKDECQEFYIENNQLKENKGGKVFPLTSENLFIEKMEIFPIDGSGWTQNDDIQPTITIFFEIIGGDQTEIHTQTTISQRNLDVPY